MGEVSLYEIFLLLRLSFDVVEFDPLPFHIGQAHILCVQGVDIGDDTSIPEVEQGIVDDKAVIRGWVEDGKVGVS
jgi:hypothetical protein